MKLAALLCTAATASLIPESLRPDFDHLRRSVVRIQAVSSAFDWLNPFIPGQDGVGLGSGFVVQTEPYPLFVTNHHVVNDAKQVTLQLLLYGEHQWQADVVLVCPKFDLALLVLRDAHSFNLAMSTQNITLQSLPIDAGVADMGEDVVALGFPLGQDSLKISKGNIAGNEDVDGNICIQSTAPISPGSSGGPLLDSRAKKVVGVNFAKATQGENINYVIPAWRVTQMVKTHLKTQPHSGSEKWRRMHVHAPKPELTTVESNEALYFLSGGCQDGVYVAKVGERSFFRNAKPAVPTTDSFLVAVNGQKLDRFGMGRHVDFAADRVSFSDLFFMVPDFSTDVSFDICHKGKLTTHSVSMAWSPEYDRGIRYVDEPHMAGMEKEFEMFGDISIMEMTVNHISAVLSKFGDPAPARWLQSDRVDQPRLIVNYVRSGSYAADVLSVGASVEKVNGKVVRTLAEFRQHFSPEEDSKVWTLDTDLGKFVALMFNESLVEQLNKAKDFGASYLLTPSVVGAAEKWGHAGASNSGEKSATSSTEDTKSKKEAQPDDLASTSRLLRGAKPRSIVPFGSSSMSAVKKPKRHSKHPQSLISESDDVVEISSLEVRAAGPLPADQNRGRGVSTERFAMQQPSFSRSP